MIQNSDKLQECRQCGQKWNRVWEPPKRRARSTSKAKAKIEKAKEKSKEEPIEEELTMFSERVPWIASTPKTRLPATKQDLDAAEVSSKENTAAANQEVVDPPGLSQSEKNVLAHLRGLQGHGIELTEQMKEQMTKLEEKEASMQGEVTLSHGHINRYHKLKAQAASTAKRIKDLDAEWLGFLGRVQMKLGRHASLYQKARGDLLEQYNMKMTDLQKIKSEVSAASLTMIANDIAEETLQESVDAAKALETLQQAMQDGAQVFSISDDEMEEEMETNGEKKTPGDASRSRGRNAMQPFRAAGSPSKVSTNHLKPKK